MYCMCVSRRRRGRLSAKRSGRPASKGARRSASAEAEARSVDRSGVAARRSASAGTDVDWSAFRESLRGLRSLNAMQIHLIGHLERVAEAMERLNG